MFSLASVNSHQLRIDLDRDGIRLYHATYCYALVARHPVLRRKAEKQTIDLERATHRQPHRYLDIRRRPNRITRDHSHKHN